MRWKKLGMGIAAGLLATSLLFGCGGGGGKSSDPGNKPGQTAASSQAKRSVEPTATFKYGEKTARLYAVKSPKLSAEIASNRNSSSRGRMVLMQDSIYVADVGGKDIQLLRIPLKDETAGDPAAVAKLRYSASVATNGRVVVYQSEENKGTVGIFDGQKAAVGGEWPGASYIVGIAGTDKFVNNAANTIQMLTLADGKFTKQVVLEDYSDISGLGSATLQPVYADEQELYFEYEVEKGDADVPCLIALDHKGKELRRFEGIGETWADWAVTKDYVVKVASKGDVQIFERATGKEIAKAVVKDFHPMKLCLLKDNSILVCDTDAKLFILDL